jgi:Ser/Thr protein kinase RdoA (MazF antagonist)
VLSFIPGEAVTPPYPAWSLTDDVLRSVARLLRSYHQAAAGFDAAAWQWTWVPPAAFDGNLACHNDLNLDNVIFRNSQAVALIDFDLASRGSPAWDVAGAIRLWAPLRPDIYINDSRQGQSLARLRTFVDAYGAPDLNAEHLVSAVLLSHDWMYRLIQDGAREGNIGFAEYWRQAAGRVAATRAWYEDHHTDLVRALTDP